MGFKWAFLFLILGLPVSVYFFLQGFGENRFDVPVYYENGVSDPVKNCLKTSGQFTVPERGEYENIYNSEPKQLTVLDIGTPDCDSCQFKVNNLISLANKFRDWHDLKIISVINSVDIGVYPEPAENWSIRSIENEKLIEFGNCGLNLDFRYLRNNKIVKNGVVVLIDYKDRIRGYYNIFDLKESDRLAIEIEILGKNMKRP